MSPNGLLHRWWRWATVSTIAAIAMPADSRALLAGLAIGLLWAPCAGPVLGAILSFAFLNGQSVTTGLLLAAYGSGCALMLALLWWLGSKLGGRVCIAGWPLASGAASAGGRGDPRLGDLIASGADPLPQGCKV